MRTLIVYHANCFDGICSAWVAKKMYPDADLFAMTHGKYDLPAGYELYSKIIFVDITLPRYELLSLKHNYQIDVQVIDHHKTAQADLEGLDFAVFDMEESGASLTWKTFFPDVPIPRLVKYIKDRDLWRYELPLSDEINAYIQSFPMTIEAYDTLFQEMRRGMGIAELVGSGILRYKQTSVERICDCAKIQTIHGYEVPVANASSLFSEVGHELCKRYPDAKFAAYYYDKLSDGLQQWGLRSIGDFDVSEIAKLSGGGGHKNAAGFQVNI